MVTGVVTSSPPACMPFIFSLTSIEFNHPTIVRFRRRKKPRKKVPCMIKCASRGSNPSATASEDDSLPLTHSQHYIRITPFVQAPVFAVCTSPRAFTWLHATRPYRSIQLYPRAITRLHPRKPQALCYPPPSLNMYVLGGLGWHRVKHCIILGSALVCNDAVKHASHCVS